MPQPYPYDPPLRLSPEDARRSSRYRLTFGISSIVLALFVGYFTYASITGVMRALSAIHDRGGIPQPTSMLAAYGIVAAYGMVALAYAGVGIWNITMRDSFAKAPVIAAIVVAAIGLIGSFVLMAEAGAAGKAPHLFGIAGNVLIAGRAIAVLRIRAVPVWPAQPDAYAHDR